eukprot:gene18182-22257_t
MAINAILEAQASLETAQTNYDGFVLDVRDAADLLQARFNLQAETINILESNRGTQISLSEQLAGFAMASRLMGLTVTLSDRIFEPIVEGIPKLSGIGANDVCAPARAAVLGGKSLIAGIAETTAASFDIASLWQEVAKEDAQLTTDIKIEKAGYKYEVQEQLKSLEQLLRNEINVRLEIYQAQRALEAAV